MKKIVFLACALLIGGFTAQAQEDSETVGATTTQTKVVVKKETSNVRVKADVDGNEANVTRNAEMKKVLEERKVKSLKIKAEKAAKIEKEAKLAKKTGVTTSEARVVTKEMLEAEKAEKKKKATKKDN
jgi:hypothetical protein